MGTPNHFERYTDSVVEARKSTDRTESVFATPAHEANRIVTAVDQAYDVRDVGLAGDARMYELRDKLTGSYIATMTLTTDMRL